MRVIPHFNPMNISVKGEYALEAIFDLAACPAGEPVRIADIAKRQKIPQKFLELILASLKQGGFVESRRGAEGGYLLARRADAITVGEVLRFVEGAPQGSGRSRHKAETPFTGLWQEVDSAVSAVVDHTTFADLLERWADRQNRFVHNWEI
jgi:Rrf2 family protein